MALTDDDINEWTHRHIPYRAQQSSGLIALAGHFVPGLLESDHQPIDLNDEATVKFRASRTELRLTVGNAYNCLLEASLMNARQLIQWLGYTTDANGQLKILQNRRPDDVYADMIAQYAPSIQDLDRLEQALVLQSEVFRELHLKQALAQIHMQASKGVAHPTNTFVVVQANEHALGAYFLLAMCRFLLPESDVITGPPLLLWPHSLLPSTAVNKVESQLQRMIDTVAKLYNGEDS